MKILNKISNTYLIFCVYAFIGWLYEVAWFIIEKQKFVNRGVLFGPFLPIYGFGVLILLFCLRKFMKKKHLSNNIITNVVSMITVVTFIFVTVIEFSVDRIYNVGIFFNEYGLLLILINLIVIVLLNIIIKKFNIKIDLTPILVFLFIWIITTVLEFVSHLIIEETTGNLLWDYKKDFLNIDKRVCFDASRNFAIGGTIALYLVQPLVDKLLKKLSTNKKLIITLIIGIPMLIDLVVNVIM